MLHRERDEMPLRIGWRDCKNCGEQTKTLDAGGAGYTVMGPGFAWQVSCAHMHTCVTLHDRLFPEWEDHWVPDAPTARRMEALAHLQANRVRGAA